MLVTSIQMNIWKLLYYLNKHDLNVVDVYTHTMDVRLLNMLKALK